MIFNRIIHFFSKKRKTKKDIDENMNNIINSMFLCGPIYDKLKSKCHPDRFIDKKQKEIAEDLFKQLQECRYNYNELLKLEFEINRLISTNKN